DVLITSTIEDVSSSVWKVAKKNGVRVMHILRSYSLMCVNANMFKEDNCNKICSTCKPFSILKKQNSKYVDDIIGISEFVLEAHLKNGYFKNAKPFVIYNMCLDEVLDERKHNGLENGNITIGYLGRIHKTKGIDLVIEAIADLPSDYKKNIIFKIAGSGDDDYVDELRSLAKKSKLICTFEGNIPANQLLDNIDVLIVPSKWNEPFGRVVIESLGRRVPVIGKRVGGIPELLKENPEFMFNTVDDLKDVITSYLKK
ncbi:TPA: glycosyltransferase, partial [Klebsiella michiganensis]|nr:glycosyltransferase [Klebsiella michiganensis]